MANSEQTKMQNNITNHIPLKLPTSTVKKVDERRINEYIDDMPSDFIQNFIRQKLPKPSKHRQVLKRPAKIPMSLSKAVLDLKLLDEPSIERRIDLFVGYCRYKNYSYNTTSHYFNILKKNGFFGETTIVPDRMKFSDTGKPHTRIVSMNDFRAFVKYLHTDISLYNAPLLIAVYTGLRTSEILQFSTYTLYQLKTRQNPVAIKRKQTVVRDTNHDDGFIDAIYWQPVYNTHFGLFIENLITLFRIEYETFLETKINNKLFYITPKTMGNRIRSQYFNSVGKCAPNGFGIHSCRNMIAMLMAENTDNIVAIQEFLQHANLQTTQKYIKAQFTYTVKEFNRITDYAMANVKRNLDPI